MVGHGHGPGLVPGNGGKKLAEATLILPLLGAAFLMPAFLNLFTHRSRLFGLPLEVLYLFFVWFALVLAAFLVSRRLKSDAPSAAPERHAEHERPTGIG